MFKNRPFQKVISVLVFLALLASTFAFTHVQTIHTDLVPAGSRISTNHREMSTISQNVKPGEEEDELQAGLPPHIVTGYGKQNPILAEIRPFRLSGPELAFLIRFPCCG